MNTEKREESLRDFKGYLELVETNLLRASLYLALNKRIGRHLQQRSARQIVGAVILVEAKNALGDAGILLLCKIYDQDNDSVGLNKILNSAESDHRYWGLSSSDAKEVKQHVKIYKDRLENSELIEKLVWLRNRVIAHPGKDALKREKKLLKKLKQDVEPLDSCKDRELFWKEITNIVIETDFNPFLSYEEIDELVDLAIQICSRYRFIVNSEESTDTSLKTEIEYETQDLMTEFEHFVNKLERQPILRRLLQNLSICRGKQR